MCRGMCIYIYIYIDILIGHVFARATIAVVDSTRKCYRSGVERLSYAFLCVPCF